MIVLRQEIRSQNWIGLFLHPELDNNWKASALSHLTLHSDFATHLLDQLIADAKPEPSTWRIEIMLIFKLPKIFKKVFDLRFWNSVPCVFDIDF